MRLKSRLLALALLLCVAAFTNFSQIANADESPCTEGCANGYNSCIEDCNSGPHPPACATNCGTKFDKCICNCSGNTAPGCSDE